MIMTEVVMLKKLLLLMMMEWMFVTLIMMMMKMVMKKMMMMKTMKMMILFTCFRVAFTSSGFMPALMHLSYLAQSSFCFLVHGACFTLFQVY